MFSVLKFIDTVIDYPLVSVTGPFFSPASHLSISIFSTEEKFSGKEIPIRASNAGLFFHFDSSRLFDST